MVEKKLEFTRGKDGRWLLPEVCSKAYVFDFGGALLVSLGCFGINSADMLRQSPSIRRKSQAKTLAVPALFRLNFYIIIYTFSLRTPEKLRLHRHFTL